MTLPGPLILYKIGAIALVLTVVAILANNKLNEIKREAYDQGVTACQAQAQEALRKVNAANANTTQKLEADLADAGRRYDDLAARRRDREQVIVREVEQALPAQPNCEITPEILALRNRIRNQ